MNDDIRFPSVFGTRCAGNVVATMLAFSAVLVSCGARVQTKWWEAQPRRAYASLKKVGTFQGWFEVYEVRENTYAIYEPYQFEETICYLLLGEKRALLVDSGMGIGNVREVVAALTSLPVSVAVTHEHFDHYGGAHRFDDVRVYNHPGAIRRLAEGVDNKTLEPQVTADRVWKPLPAGFNRDTWTIPSIEPTALLEDGMTIDLGGRSLEVIHTPGHTPGSLCLLDRAGRILFTGDHFYPGPLYLYSDDANVEDYRASTRRLVSLIGEYDHVLGGHNEPLVKSDALRRVSDALEAIFSGGGTFSEKSGVRRYSFKGFEVLIRADGLKPKD